MSPLGAAGECTRVTTVLVATCALCCQCSLCYGPRRLAMQILFWSRPSSRYPTPYWRHAVALHHVARASAEGRV